MNLGNSGFVYAEERSDLFHREFLVVVKGHHEAFPLGKTVDCLVQNSCQFFGFESNMGVIAAVVRIVIDLIVTAVIQAV
jgi:hypothetical protein